MSDKSSEQDKKRDRRGIVVRSAGMIPTVGSAAKDAVVSGTRRFGRAGTGIKISQLSGAAQTNATKAAIGGGPKANGGYGIKGGNIVLGVIEATPYVLALAAMIAEEVIKAKAEKRAILPSAPAVPADS